MMGHKHYRFYIGLTSIVILVVGLLLGASLTANLGNTDLLIVNMGLSFTLVVLLLIIGGLVLEMMEMLESKKNKK